MKLNFKIKAPASKNAEAIVAKCNFEFVVDGKIFGGLVAGLVGNMPFRTAPVPVVPQIPTQRAQR